MHLEPCVLNEAGQSSIEPEINLIAAVIYRAMRDVLNATQTEEAQYDKICASRWLRLDSRFLDSDVDSLFSFVWCCHKLDVCPKLVKRRILYYRENGIQVEV